MVNTRVKTNLIIESQLPSFVREEFPLVAEFLKQYYISLENQGASADIIQNIDQYVKVDSLSNLTDQTTLSSNVSFFDTDIFVETTYGFPDRYGLIQINNEVITYTGKTSTSFTGCVRGFSGITSLKNSDNSELVFTDSNTEEHVSGDSVINLSVLFLKEFFKKVKTLVTPGFENIEFNSNLNENVFIKQAKDFYSLKGTDESFKILFGALYKEPVEVIKPRDYLIRPSDSQFRIVKDLVVEAIEGDPLTLLNQTIYQSKQQNLNLAYAPVTNVQTFNENDKTYYVLSIDYDYNKDIIVTGAIYGDFDIHPSTKLVSTATVNQDFLDVDSTLGFPDSGTLSVKLDNETILKIEYTSKSSTQFFGCSGITQEILETTNINLDVYASNYEDAENTTANDLVKFRITGVISDIKFDTDTRYYSEGDDIYIKTLGEELTDPRSKSFIYNLSIIYDIKSFRKEGNDTNLKYSFQTFDDNVINIGDRLLLSYVAKFPSGFQQTIDKSVNEIIVVNGINIPKKEFSALTTYPIVEASRVKRLLSKTNFDHYPEILNKYSTNVLNSYVDSENNLYVSSSSLPSFDVSVQTKERAISFSGISSATNILEYKNHGFYTGESVRYTYTDVNNKIINLSDRKYYVEKLDNDRLKIYNSQIDIYTTKYSSSGEDLSISLLSSSASSDLTNTLTRYSVSTQDLETSKIIRKFSTPQASTKSEETKPGFVGIFVNGVEILNYKSKNSIYYGQIEKIDVLDKGKNYDVINPPNLYVSDNLGYGATGNVFVTGSLDRVEIIDKGHDYLEVPFITITGGNGSGAKAEANLVSYDHVVQFNASQYRGSVNLANDTIAFSTYHRFRNNEKVIYETSNQSGLVGLTTNSFYYVGIQDANTIKLFKTFEDATVGVNTVGISSFGAGIHSLRSSVKKKRVGSVTVIDPGKNYSNKKNVVYSSSVNTAKNTIFARNHGYSDGEIINYSYSSSAIGGLSSTSYYVKTFSPDEFYLCEVGIGTTNKDFYYQTNQFVNLTSASSGQHIFNYPEITISISGKIGVSTFTPGNQNAVIRPIFRGSIDSVSLASTTTTGINIGGTGYGAKEIIDYNHQPNLEILQGSNAQLTPIISNGSIVEIVVENGGSGYVSIPDLEIIGTGSGASLTPILINGTITSVIVVNGGTGYEKQTFINVLNSGSGANLYANIKEWKINEVARESVVQSEGSVIVESVNGQNLQYSSLYASDNLRKLVFSQVFFGGDIKYISDFSNDSVLASKKNHSPIVGWAYDGNPIYGPYGYANPLSPTSNVVTLRSGYIANENLQSSANRPPFTFGFFVDDFIYKGIGDLDEHNGRYCVTPEYPNGVYAYFCPIDSQTKIPQFPYVIGNRYRDLPIQFNFETSSNENRIDLNETGWKRNTYHYNLNKVNSEYSFITQSNKIREQVSKVESILSGSIDSIGIKTGGLGYKIGDVVKFDNSGTNGFGAAAKVESVEGEKVNSISYSTLSLKNIQFYSDRNFSGTVGVCTSPHNLENNDIISISGLTTSTTDLYTSFNVKTISNTLKFANGIGSTSVTGIITYFEVLGNLDFPNIIENDVLSAGNEKVKVLTIDKQNSRIKVLRSYQNTVGTSHSDSEYIFESSRKFTVSKNVGLYDDYVINRELYFNPSETIGIGTSFGIGIGATIYFSNPGSGATSKYISTKTLYFENHNLKTGDRLTYSSNGGTPISVSSNGSTIFQLTDESTVYVAKVSNDLIGISTFKVGLSSTGNFVGIDSSFSNQGTLFLTAVGSGINHSFKTNYENNLVGSATKNTVTILTNNNHNVSDGSLIDVDVIAGVSTTIKVFYNDTNRRAVFNPKQFTASNISVSTNTITISNHNYVNGTKVIHTSTSPAGGLTNDQIYYVVVIDRDTIKLANSYYNSTKNIPEVVDITSSVGASGTFYEINPNIKLYKNQQVIFDLSDSSLSFVQNLQRYSAFKLQFFTDKNLLNHLNTDKISQNLDAGFANASLILNIDDTLPTKLYYSLIPTNSNRTIVIPSVKQSIIVDSENIQNNNSIDIVSSLYSGKHTVSGVTTNTISYNINYSAEYPTYTKFNSDLKYDVLSGVTTGAIKSLIVTHKGKNYTTLPGITSVISTDGYNAILTPESFSIGKVNSINVSDYGFDYSPDLTIKPHPKLPSTLKIDPLNSIEKINVVSKGKNYTTPPNLVLIDGFTNKVVDDLVLDFSLENGVVSILQNTKGIYSATHRIIPLENSNGSKIKNIGFNTSTKDVTVVLDVGFLSGFSTASDFPFSIGDKILIENTSVSAASTGFMPRGYNSQDYDYNLFTIQSVDANIGGVNPSIVFNLSDYFSGVDGPGTFNSLKSSGRVIAEKDFPVFEINLKKNEFFVGEEIVSDLGESGIVQKFDSANEHLKVSSKNSFAIDSQIQGKSSNSKAFISDIISYNSEYDINSTSVVKSGSKTEIGFLNNSQQRIHDNDYYQYFSYSLKSKVSYDNWSSTVDHLNHTAGFKKFGDLIIESSAPISGISTDQNFGLVIATAEIVSDADLNCVYDFDLVRENSINVNSKIISDEIIFGHRIVQDYIKATGNVVLKIDDISSLFDDTARVDVFSVVDNFSLTDLIYKKYFILVEDTFFTDIKQFNIVSLLQDGSNGFINQYGRVDSNNNEDLGSFDYRIFGSEGQLLFYPTDSVINDYNLSYITFNIKDSTGIGSTSLGNVVNIQSYNSSLNIGYASTTIVGIASTYRCSKLLVEINSIDSTYSEIDEITILHDNTDVHILEYGQLDSSLLNPLAITGIGTYNSYISGNNVNVDLIPNAGVTTDYNINVLSVSIGSTLATGIGTYNLSTGKLSSGYVSISSSISPVANTIATVYSPAKGAYLIASVEDNTNNQYQVCELVALNNGVDTFITDFGNIETNSGLGTFSSELSGSNMSIKFTPNSNIDVQVRVFVTSLNVVDPLSSFGTIDFTNATIDDNYGLYIGRENDIKKSFYLTHNNLPIFHRYFTGNSSEIVNLSADTVNIADHFFRTGERLTYFYDNYQNSTENAIGIGTTLVGAGTTDKLPRDLYAVKVDNYSIKLATTAEKALKTIPEVLDLTSVGIGTNHKFVAYNENNRVLISIDNIIQSPLVSTSTTTSLLESISFADNLIKLSNITNLFPENLININDEIMKISAVGFGSTNVVRVQRKALGSELKSHTSNSLVSKVDGSYNIVDNTINFISAPYGPSPIGSITNSPDERDFSGLTNYSRFNGRVFMRSSAPNSANDPYTSNYIFDDISHNFTGIKSDFALKVDGSDITGISSSNAILLINDIFQGPENSDISPVLGNYYLQEKSGITSVFFKGSGIATAYDVNTSGVPIGGVIVSVGSTSGFGYQPLVSAGGTAIVSGLGTISSISIGNSGSGYRSGIQTVRVAVTTSSLETPNLEFIGTATVSNGTIVSVAITNPGAGYTSTNPPIVIFDYPLSYSNIPLVYSSSSTGVGTEAKVDIVVGQGSSVINFEIINDGYNYKLGDTLTVPTGGLTGIPTDPTRPFNEFKIIVDRIYNNKFSAWTVGDLQILDDFSNEFDGSAKSFQLKIDGVPISILADKNTTIDLSSTLLVFINDILQIPGEAYVFDGGSIITFTEAPKGADEYWDGDTLKIYFYRGTSSVDTLDVDILETIKVGDDLKIYDNSINSTENDRSINIINSSNTVITNSYSGPGISTDQFFERPVIWCRQTEDRVINGKVVGKDRQLYEPNIEPTTIVIRNVGIGSTVIFVENVRTFFDNEKEDASNNFISKIRILSQEPKVGAYATAIVSAGGSISYIDLINPGSGYTFAPNIVVSSPIGFGSTALISASITGGLITGITTIGVGSNYSQDLVPSVLIEPPTIDNEIVENVVYAGDFGVITGINTANIVGVASTAIIFDLYVEKDSFLRDASVVGTAITISGIQTGYYFVVRNSNVGFGVTSLDQSGSIVSVGNTFLDNVYNVSSVSIGTTNVPGIGLTYVAKVAVSVQSYNGLSGLGFSGFYGEYSWGRITFPDGSRKNPKSFTINNLNGLVGLETAPLIKRYNPLRYFGYTT